MSEPHKVSPKSDLDLYRENQRLESEVKGLQKQIKACKNSILAQSKLLSECRTKIKSLKEAQVTLDSERAANQILTNRLEELLERCAKICDDIDSLGYGAKTAADEIRSLKESTWT